MKIRELYELYRKNYLVDTDTRKIRKGTIFFALKGENFNGNKFAIDALERGAEFSVVDEEEYKINERVILVDDVLSTLQKLANYHRKALNIPIIGLTGSNGKTTTKELINCVLSSKYRTTATQGNYNNHIGVPLTLLSMTNETEIGIVEMGANHKEEIKMLSEIAEPTIGYITNFGKAHLEGFGGVEGVIQGKSELYRYIISSGGTLIINPNDSIQIEKSEGANTYLFTENIGLIKVDPFVRMRLNGNKMKSNLIGAYNYFNIVAAVTIGKYFELDEESIINAIEGYVPTNNRSQIISKGSNEIILDAYNANPTSMKASIENFKEFGKGEKVVIIGDMFELGDNSSEEHQNIVDLVEELGFEEIIFVGDNFAKSTVLHGKQFSNFDLLAKYLENKKFENSKILIKGSRAMALERSLEYIK
ncbi:UDP-N-acetylmuramoyl-tripeptide--D-alanyl-D-alanine ligase [Tenacibaculum sp. SZ-18]|uniref:UDP-N-acetylmuramoyl-tripeptide--D-alanyl-D- alanine ligase n=1 Tax=Tenacibaculum sp. SZ-18 TaxID=754423 RepID=UPI000C2D2CBB|nr:UDP-N-acetylmuramoyl-tripeptide--D-alanyl-D-alanine ligase [Tenacibaculum sp. SZ-18]AUC14186.1 UDP-N-acetylmuramoyl-tripeptide--D-alanyl-D-alanine ligase [Tenacibaculum sp. SZ-18]